LPDGFVRQYIPKGTDFDEVTDAFLEDVEQALNNRPRKRYGFLTPLQRFSELTGLPASRIL
jgi:IS30 family transposase